MGVYISGLEIPKNCKECMFADMDDIDFDYVLYCKATKKYADLDRYDHPMGWNCPITEIPTPHGRLGDLDELKKKVLTWLPSDPCGQEEKEFPFETDICVSMLMEIEEAESIIEAEE